MTATLVTRAAVVACLGMLVAGCGQQAGPAREGAGATDAPTTSAAAPSRPGAPSQERRVRPRCRGGDPLAVGRAPVEAGLGHRYLLLDVRNCTSRPVVLDDPTVLGVTGSGRRGELRVRLTPVANRPAAPYTLAPGATAHAGVEWLAEPRGRRVRELRVSATRADRPDRLRIEPLEVRLSTHLDYYPWVPRPAEVFGS